VIFIFGLVQMLSVLFLMKYADLIYLPYYSILFMCSAQAFSLGVISARNFLMRFKILISYFYLLSLFWLCRATLGSAMPPILVSMVFCLTYYQAQIISFIEKEHSRFKNAYAAEMAGAVCGTFVWFFASSALGFKGFIVIHLLVFCLCTLKEAKPGKLVKLSQILLAVLVFLSYREPQPIFNKRQRYDFLKNGQIEDFKWDPAGYVELLRHTSAPDMRVLLFDGGGLRSTSSRFDGNYPELKNRYLKSETFGVWSLDVVLPAYVLRSQLKSAMLISAVGGQEVLAAKAFGAEDVWAVDINKSAQDYSRNKLRDFNGHLFDNVNVVTLDGRKAVADSNRKFDIIQIYSANNAAFLGGIGGSLRPSSLVTVEAFQDYLSHLNDNGIVHLYMNNYPGVKKTVLEAVRRAELKNAVLALKAPRTDVDLTNFYLKKNGWSPEELKDTLEWLNRAGNGWDVLIDPFSGETENGKNWLEKDRFSKYKNIFGPATDDWPFIDYMESPVNSLVGSKAIYIFVFCVLTFSCLAFFGKTKKNTFDAGFFWIGFLFGILQEIFLLSMQKIIGRPDLGLTIALSVCLLISISVLRILKTSRLNEKLFAALFVILGCAGLMRNDFAYLAASFFMLILQSFIFTLKLNAAPDKFRWIWWTNGLGFVLGACFFYIGFSYLGMQKLFVVVAGSYVVLSVLLLKNKKTPHLSAGFNNLI
jgi:hypothetical protein